MIRLVKESKRKRLREEVIEGNYKISENADLNSLDRLLSNFDLDYIVHVDSEEVLLPWDASISIEDTKTLSIDGFIAPSGRGGEVSMRLSLEAFNTYYYLEIDTVDLDEDLLQLFHECFVKI